MTKNYFLYFLFFLINSILPNSIVNAQEIKIFNLTDFDLVGEVKSCVVITNYGKEEFEFNRNGLLTKLVTRYSETDYDKTYYKYANGELIEKRLENYREGNFDKTTSIANIYTLDTTSKKKITEKIISYAKEFIDQYEYTYNTKGNLTHIKRTNNTGIDKTEVIYTNYKGELTVSYFLNGVLQKSIRRSKKKPNYKVVLTKEFMEGKPDKALEQTYNEEEKIISELYYSFSLEAKEFVIAKNVNYGYDDMGMLSEVKSKEGEESETVKNYIYQHDNGDTGNWIKKIITPDNTYITREIEYYIPEMIEEEKP